ncbi:MAG: hypothetical protein ACR2F8_02200 [Caulobacteraceae bacterium]
MIDTRVPAFGQPGDWNSQQGVEDGEGQAAQQAQLGVGDLQVDLDRLADGGHDGAVDEVEGVGKDQEAQDGGLVAVGKDGFSNPRGCVAQDALPPRSAIFSGL